MSGVFLVTLFLLILSLFGCSKGLDSKEFEGHVTAIENDRILVVDGVLKEDIPMMTYELAIKGILESCWVSKQSEDYSKFSKGRG